MYEKIKQDIVNFMKAKEMLKVQTLRGVKGEIDLEHINTKAEINDDLTITVLTRQIKTRKESILEFERGNRNDLIEKTNMEISFLESYLPEPLSKEELEKIIEEIFLKVKPTSSKDMGLIMRELTPLIKGKADMKEVSMLIKDKLSNLN